MKRPLLKASAIRESSMYCKTTQCGWLCDEYIWSPWWAEWRGGCSGWPCPWGDGWDDCSGTWWVGMVQNVTSSELQRWSRMVHRYGPMYWSNYFLHGRQRALSYTQRNATPDTTQVFFASFSPMQLSFSCPAPHCLNSKCTYTHLFAHGRAGLKTRCVQAHCWCVAILKQLKTIVPLLMAQYFLLFI